MPTLSAGQRLKLATASLDNVSKLLAAGEGLAQSGSVPSAGFLIITAFEELMKARRCLEDEAGSSEKWWSGFYDHKTKLNKAREYFPELPQGYAAKFMQLRERFIYVDVKDDGDPLTPSGLVDPGGLTADFVLGFAAWVRQASLETLKEVAARQSGE